VEGATLRPYTHFLHSEHRRRHL